MPRHGKGGFKGFALAIVIGLGACPWAASAQTLADARHHYDQERFEEAARVLESVHARAPTADSTRLLGLTYHRLLQYEKALPLLEEAVTARSNDFDVQIALAEVHLALGEPQAALRRIEHAIALRSDSGEAYLLLGRIQETLGAGAKAVEAYHRAAELDAGLSGRAGMRLVNLYAREGRYGQVQDAVRQALRAAPESYETAALQDLLQALDRRERPFEVHIGYRVENDNNVILEPNNVVVQLDQDDESDVRHILLADVLGQYRLTGPWSLYGEAHLYKSLYNDLDEFEELRQNYVGSLGWTKGNYGFRIPVEVTRVELDGDTYLDAYAFTPGAYIRLANGATLHGYGRFRDEDYDEQVPPAEDRSGDRRGLGVLVLWPFHGDRGEVRAIIEHDTYDTEGRNWDRDHTRFFGRVRYRFLPGLYGGVGFERIQEDFDNVHDTFIIRREDRANIWFIDASYELGRHWEFFLQASTTQWDSNIAIYEYERDVVGLGVSWHY